MDAILVTFRERSAPFPNSIIAFEDELHHVHGSICLYDAARLGTTTYPQELVDWLEQGDIFEPDNCIECGEIIRPDGSTVPLACPDCQGEGWVYGNFIGKTCPACLGSRVQAGCDLF